MVIPCFELDSIQEADDVIVAIVLQLAVRPKRLEPSGKGSDQEEGLTAEGDLRELGLVVAIQLSIPSFVADVRCMDGNADALNPVALDMQPSLIKVIHAACRGAPQSDVPNARGLKRAGSRTRCVREAAVKKHLVIVASEAAHRRTDCQAASLGRTYLRLVPAHHPATSSESSKQRWRASSCERERTP